MRKSFALILGAGALWGFMGVFTRIMGGMGFSSADTVMLRCGTAGLMYLVVILLRGGGLLRIRLRDLWCFFGGGICSMLFFTFCYFQAIKLTSLAAAAILLYTAPMIVMVISLFVFGERLTAAKIVAAVMAFAGCCLVSSAGSGGLSVSAAGLIYGLCAGFGYALYSVFARLAIDRGYSSLTINFYCCALAAVGAAVIWGPAEPVCLMFSGWKPLLTSCALGFVTCFLPYLMYTRGLERVEAGRASVMASVEPVVAAVSGAIVFHEELTLFGVLGMLLVLGAIAVLNAKLKKS